MFVPLGCKSQCFNVGIDIFGFSHFVLKLQVKYGIILLSFGGRIPLYCSVEPPTSYGIGNERSNGQSHVYNKESESTQDT